MGVLAQATQIDTGDTAWMLAATALVLLMTPALGLFYTGFVRPKNALNTFMMSVASIAVGAITWALVGYSLAFDGTGDLIGGLGHAFMSDVGFEPRDGSSRCWRASSARLSSRRVRVRTARSWQAADQATRRAPT